jgi:hypothetical protein
MSIQTDPNAGGQSERDDSLSESDLIDLMAGEDEQQEDTEETDEDTEETDAEEEVEETETEEEETESDDEETEGIDLENLTDEQWELVRTRLKSRAAADIQRLKRESKAKDAQIAALQGQQPQAATSAEPVESRFLKDVDTVEKLSEKVVALKKLAKDTERILDDHDDYGPQDYIEVGDKSYTKRQLKELSREIRDTLDEAVPYYQSKFQRHSLIEQESVEAMTRVRKSVAEMSDEKSPVAKTFKDLTDSEMFQKICNAVPEARPVLTLLAGFGTKGILAASARKGTAPAATGKPSRANPPSTPSGAAAPSQGRSGDPKGKKAAVLEKRFQESGDPEDLIKAMSAV